MLHHTQKHVQMYIPNCGTPKNRTKKHIQKEIPKRLGLLKTYGTNRCASSFMFIAHLNT
jgi:hypothetical protein